MVENDVDEGHLVISLDYLVDLIVQHPALQTLQLPCAHQRIFDKPNCLLFHLPLKHVTRR